MNGSNLVRREKACETRWHAGVENNTHARLLRRARFRFSDKRLAGKFEHRNGMFARYVWKVGEKFGQLVSALDVVDERSHGDARAGEARFTTLAGRSGGDEGIREGHGFTIEYSQR